MKVTYLYHSGFLVEWENCCFLFDYIRGDLPQQAMQKTFFVFCSHSHGDHFTPTFGLPGWINGAFPIGRERRSPA